MDLDKMRAQLQKARKTPGEKTAAGEAARPKAVKAPPLVDGDESIYIQLPVAKEEFPISAPEVLSSPAMEPVAEEQPSEPQKEKSPIEKAAAVITKNVERVMNEVLSQIEERIGGLTDALETHTKATDEKIGRIEESMGNLDTKMKEIRGVTNELEKRVNAAGKSIQDMKNTRDVLEGRVDQAQAATQNMQEETTRLGNAMANLKEKSVSLEASLDGRFNSVGELMDGLDKKIDEAQGAAGSLSQQMANLGKETNQVRNLLNSVAAKSENGVTILEKKVIDKLREIVNGFQKDVTGINSRIGEAQEAVKGLTQQVKNAESRATAVGTKTNALEADMKRKFDTVGEGMDGLDGKIDGVQETANASLGKLERLLGIVETNADGQMEALEDFLGKGLRRRKILGDIVDTIIKELLVKALKTDDYKDYNREDPPGSGILDEKELLQELSSDPEFVRTRLAKTFFGDIEPEELKKKLNDPRNAEIKKWVDNTTKLILTRAQECARGDV